MAELESLHARLAALADSPLAPRAVEAHELERLLGAFPALARDEAYLAFLRRYGGAYVRRKALGLSVDIFGLGGSATTHAIAHRRDNLAPGYCLFATVYHQTDGPTQADFAFPVEGAPEVYRSCLVGRQPPTAFERYATGFLPWLEHLVASGGLIYDDLAPVEY